MDTPNNTIKDKIVELTKKFVAIESVRANAKQLHEILNLVKKQLETEFPIEEFESNGIHSLLIRNTPERPKCFKLLLNAHLDVVLAKEDQFSPYEKDGKLHGRGTFDMKGAAATMILLFKEIAKNLPYSIGLQIVCDEEVGGENGTEEQIRQGVRADFILFGEGTNMQIFNEGKGRIAIRLTATGKAAHSGYSWQGDNAILKIHEAIKNIKQAFPEPDEEVWGTLINVIQVGTSNTALNKIPEDCFAHIDIRVIHEDEETILKKFASLLPEGVKSEIVLQDPPHKTESDNPFIINLQKSIKGINGKESQLRSAHGFSDLSYYSEIDCAGVEFGPIGEGNHGDHEWVDIKSLEEYYEILKHFLLSIK